MRSMICDTNSICIPLDGASYRSTDSLTITYGKHEHTHTF